ncbi:uncharacterized protein ACRADG_009676 [Cochliomyia hominivorax]
MLKTIVLSLCILSQQLISDSKLLRNKRFLIFPRQAPTRHQFIGGIGIPVDLSYESLTIGYVLKAMFWLPYNETVFRENPYFPEYKNDKFNNSFTRPFNSNFVNARSIKNMNKGSKLRWDIYDIIIQRLNGYGYKGQECLLRAICEANALQFMRHVDVYGELMHIFFSPSSSRDAKSDKAADFIQAEKLGLSGDSCTSYDCSLSILDLISKILKVD